MILLHIGKVSDDVKDLVVTTYECWKAAIAVCKPGVKYNKIGGDGYTVFDGLLYDMVN
jgi:methionine aminopeptidase